MKKEINHIINLRLYIIPSIFIILLALQIIAPPPSPYNIEGKVLNPSGTGVENGIIVRINDTDSNNTVITYVSAPPIPSLKGAYSVTIYGNIGDNLIVTSWNSSHYGINTSILANRNYINVILNNSRASETNITILSLNNNTRINNSNINQISAEITIIGSQDGTDCYAKLNISNNYILNLSSDTYLHYLGDINLGETTTTNWNVYGKNEGNTNISVSSYCLSDDIILENLNYDIRYNLTLVDEVPPVIELKLPLNNTATSAQTITFSYNITDRSKIINCSLYINNKFNKTNKTIKQDLNQYFQTTLEQKNYNWSIRCIDNTTSKNIGYSHIYNLTINQNSIPTIKDMTIDTSIDLNQGEFKKVSCNFTLTDLDNISDIKNLSSVFYHSSVQHNEIDDNNYHYTNNSCTLLSSSEYEQDFSCGFEE